MPMCALALPKLHSSVPMTMRIAGENILTAPLAIALLEANLITGTMLTSDKDMAADEHALSTLALSTWWDSIQYQPKYFNWTMHVQELEDYTGRHREGRGNVGWFCLRRNDNVDMPRFTLARGIGELESTLEGYGQTVLAVLHDACLHLPDALDPWRAASYAEYLYWHDSSTDEELLEDQRIERGYDTVQEVLDDDDVLTRAEFYKHIPRWVTAPRRVLARQTIVDAAQSSHDHEVIAACDAIAALAGAPRFRLKPHEIGAHQFCDQCIDGCMVLLWTSNDQISRALDDALNDFGESGEYSEYIDAHPLRLTGKDFKRYKARTEQMMQLATLTERLLDLIGDQI